MGVIVCEMATVVVLHCLVELALCSPYWPKVGVTAIHGEAGAVLVWVSTCISTGMRRTQHKVSHVKHIIVHR